MQEKTAQSGEFKARSGRVVKPQADGSIRFGLGIGYLGKAEAFDAAEYFQAERDVILGRWRWPENPEWVAVEGDRSLEGRTVVVVNERTLDRFWFNERVRTVSADSDAAHQAGRAFFEAHPVLKPWHEAKPGEVWVLTIDGDECVAVADSVDFNGTNERGNFITFRHNDEDIEAGRRIYPELTS